MATAITIEGLTKRFGKTTAVDRVDLHVPAGNLFFLLGPSGCGKTTLLRMLAGFTDPDAGTIRLGSRVVTHLPANRRNTGMVFQSYALWPHLSVRDNVAFGLNVRRVPAKEKQSRIDAALAAVQMQDYAGRKPNELSGGQQQRVALARALVIKPDVLLLDEPLSNLDAKLRLDMRQQIRDLCRQFAMTAVYVTHDQKEALSMADQMAVLHAGRVVQVGPPRTLYHQPASRLVADFLGETNFIAGKVTSISGTTASLDTEAGTIHAGVLPDALQVGETVTCSIRPEAIRLVPEPSADTPPQANHFTAELRETVYLGEMSQHHMQVTPAVRLKVYEMNPRTQQAGGTRRIAFDPESVVVLRN